MSFLQSHTFDVVNALSFLTIVGQVFALSLIVCLSIEWIRNKPSPSVSWVYRHGLLLLFIVALTATSGSLFFSEIAQWTPCKDCWFQRIFLYPQAVILLIALWKRDRAIAPYIFTLSVIGIVISALHYTEQVEAALHPVPEANGVNALLKPCDASGVSCAATQIKFAFGYITIPMMAGTASLLNAVGSFILFWRGRKG